MKIYKTFLFLFLLVASQSLFAQTYGGTGVWQPPNNISSPYVNEGLYGFFDGDNATGIVVMTYGDHITRALNLKHDTPDGNGNDMIRSMVVKGPMSNKTLVLFDNPDGQTDDDYSVIKVNGTLPGGTRIVIPNLEGGAATITYWTDGVNSVTLTPHYHNGLNGKVSHISRAIGQ